MGSSEQTGRGRPHRKRRRRIVLTALGILLVAAVWSIPYLLSTAAGTRFVLGLVNERIRGTVELGELSLSWTGPSRVAGLTVSDPDGREVLRVEEGQIPGGLWRLLTDAERFDRAELAAPAAHLYLDSRGVPSLVEALQPVEPPSEPTDELPALRGTLTVRDGRAAVIRPDGRSYEVAGIEATVDLDTLDRLHGVIHALPQGGGKVLAEWNLTSLASGEAPGLDGAEGTFAVRTDGLVELAPLLDLFGRADQAGQIAGDVTGSLRDGQIEAAWNLRTRKLRSTGREWSDIRPINVQLAGAMTAAPGTFAGQADLTGEPGELHASFTYREGEDEPPDLAKAVAQLLRGRPVALPDFSLEASGRVDLPRLGQALPSLLRLLPDVRIAAGTLQAKQIAIQGGSRPTARAEVLLTDLRATTNGKPIACGPLSVTADAQMDEKSGLQVRRAALWSDFGSLDAWGTLADLRVDFQADLALARATLGRVFDLDALPHAGAVSAELQFRPHGDDRVDVTVDASAKGLELWDGQRVVRIDSARLLQTGHLRLDEQTLAEAVIAEATVGVDRELSAGLKGSVSLTDSAFRLKAIIARADAGALFARAEQFGIPLGDIERYTGTVEGSAEIARDAKTGALRSTGKATVTAPQVDGQAIAGKRIDLVWSGLVRRNETGQIDADAVTLRSEIAELHAKQVRLVSGEDLRAEGKMVVLADLRRCMAAAAAVGKWDDPPRLAGQLSWTGQAASAGETFRITGAGTVDGFRVGGDDMPFREEKVTFSHGLAVDGPKEIITVESVELTSSPLWLKLAGSVRNFRSDWRTDLAGQYKGSGAELTRLLHEFAPATAETISLTGQTGGRITIAGPAYRPKDRPVYRGLTVKTDVGWDRAAVGGVPLGKTTFAPVLRDGRLVIPDATASASGGTARLGGVLDLTGRTPTYRLTGPRNVLEDVQITREIGRDLLSRFNPVFAQITSIEGSVTLEVADVDVPLGEMLTRKARGRGTLDLRRLKVRPEGILRLILQFGDGGRQRMPVLTDAVRFSIRDGRVHYDNFTLSLPDGTRAKFYGSVGFDDTVDLAVSVPVTAGLLRLRGVRGKGADFARVLSGVRVVIPILGTRLQPRFALGEVDVGPLIRQATQALLAEQAGRLLEGVGRPGPRADDRDDLNPKRALDSLLDLIRGDEDRKDRSGHNGLEN